MTAGALIERSKLCSQLLVNGPNTIDSNRLTPITINFETGPHNHGTCRSGILSNIRRGHPRSNDYGQACMGRCMNIIYMRCLPRSRTRDDERICSAKSGPLGKLPNPKITGDGVRCVFFLYVGPDVDGVPKARRAHSSPAA